MDVRVVERIANYYPSAKVTFTSGKVKEYEVRPNGGAFTFYRVARNGYGVFYRYIGRFSIIPSYANADEILFIANSRNPNFNPTALKALDAMYGLPIVVIYKNIEGRTDWSYVEEIWENKIND